MRTACFAGLLLFLVSCSSDSGNDVTSGASDVSGSDVATDTGGGAVTDAACAEWIAETTFVPTGQHGCLGSVFRAPVDQLLTPDDVQQYWEGYFASVAELDGGSAGILPVGSNRFYAVWFPDNWESQGNDRRLVVTLHGSDGCLDSVFEWWQSYTGRTKPYAIVALQYADSLQAERGAGYPFEYAETDDFDDADTIYANLNTILGDVESHCPIAGVPIVYHGFSRGAARSFELAFVDWDQGGQQLFEAFISDSGTPFADVPGGGDPDCWDGADDPDYNGARFWLFCGTEDSDGQTCRDQDRANNQVSAHNGVVDRFYEEAGRGHGVFNGTDHNPQSPTEAQTVMFDYVDSFAP